MDHVHIDIEGPRNYGITLANGDVHDDDHTELILYHVTPELNTLVKKSFTKDAEN